jgi:hypothetical protein
MTKATHTSHTPAGRIVGVTVVLLGMWAAVAPSVVGIHDVLSILPGVAIALAGVGILRGGPRAAHAFLALAGTMAFLIAPVDSVFATASSLSVAGWVAAFFVPGAVIALLAVKTLEAVEPARTAEEPVRGLPGRHHSTATRTPARVTR